MATILKERPAIIRIPCSQALAARLKRLEDIAVKRGIDLDLSPVSASIEKLVSQAERELLPPPAPVQQPTSSAAELESPPAAARPSSDRCAYAAGRGGNRASQPRKTKPKAKPSTAKAAA